MKPQKEASNRLASPWMEKSNRLISKPRQVQGGGPLVTSRVRRALIWVIRILN